MPEKAISISSSVIFSAVCFFAFGMLLSIISYPQLSILSAVGVYMLTGFALLYLSGVRKRSEYKVFFLSFAVCIFWFGISSIYFVIFKDPHQNLSDPSNFYRLATNGASGLDLTGISLLSEGALAVFIWRNLYDLFSFIGFDEHVYIGILFNCLIVSLVSVLSLRTAVLIFDNDERRINLFLLLFNTCAIFWLFATIHIRDSVILLLNTYLIWRAVNLMLAPTLKKCLVLGITFFVCTIIYPFLRTEFVFVPMAIGLSMVFAYVIQLKTRGAKIRYLGALILVSIVFVGLFSSQISVIDTLLKGKEGYEAEISEVTTQSSLGVALVVSQPLLIRLIVGTIYLHIYPIPFWYGFQLDSIYDLYKSLQVIFLWFTLPLFVLGVKNILTFPRKVSSALVFLFCLYLGFSLAISISSLETRHIGVFAVPLLIISIIPDFRLIKHRNTYKIYLLLFLTMILLIHIAWAILKFI